MNISKKLTLIPVMAVISLVLLSYLSFNSLNQLNNSIHSIYIDRVIPLKELKSISDKYAVDVIDALNKYSVGLKSRDDVISEISRAIETSTKIYDKYLATELTSEEEKLALTVKDSMYKTNQLLRNIVVKLANNNDSDISKIIVEAYQIVDPITSSINKLISIQLDITEDVYNHSTALSEKTTLINGTISVLFSAIQILISFLIIKAITSSLNNISSTMNDIETITICHCELKPKAMMN